MSGLYFFGSGERFPRTWGQDLRRVGSAAAAASSLRLRPDGTIIPRNDFVGKPLHRVDLRLQRRFPLGGRAGIDGILEVFNLANHENYGNYVTNEASSNFQLPQQTRATNNVAFIPRTLQLGFRFAF